MSVIRPGTLCFLVGVPSPHQDFEGRVVTVESGPALDPEDGVMRYLCRASWYESEIFAPRMRLLPISDPRPVREEPRTVGAT
jgi:hypothetical protein